jgi:uncharacterized membrane protein YbhN (UPF0104 family)
MAEPSPRRWIGPTVKLALSLAMVAAVLAIADLAAVGAAITAIGAGSLALAVLLCFSQIMISGLRWYVVGAGTGGFIGPWQTLRAMFAAMFCNQLLPTSIGGDLVRVGLLTRHGLTVGRAARTVILDRTAGLLSLLTLMAVTGIVFSNQLPEDWPVALIRAVPLVAIAVVLAGLFLGDRLAGALEARGRLAWVAGLLRDSSQLLRQGHRTAVILLLSYAIHGASAGAVWVLATGSGLGIGYAEVLGFLPIVILAQLLPISIAGWGVREGTVVTLFALLGIGAAPAAAVSILWGGAIAAGALLAGIIWALTRRSGERLPGRDPSQAP